MQTDNMIKIEKAEMRCPKGIAAFIITINGMNIQK